MSFGDNMVYAPTYESADTSAIFIDILGGVLVSAVGLATIIGLILLYRWFKKKGVAKV